MTKTVILEITSDNDEVWPPIMSVLRNITSGVVGAGCGVRVLADGVPVFDDVTDIVDWQIEAGVRSGECALHNAVGDV